jgi:murein DD-endopeptidase MepM/ murein hydrolase activator NlpD
MPIDTDSPESADRNRTPRVESTAAATPSSGDAGGHPSAIDGAPVAMPRKRRRRRVIGAFALLLAAGFVAPELAVIPVEGAGPRDWNPRSFWFEPWGASGVHKGIDIFAPKGRRVVATTYGLVLFRGEIERGGKVVVALGPKWRLHYYAHLDSVQTGLFTPLRPGSALGTVGDSGNAAGKPPHLHYSVVSLLPLPWKATAQSQGWKRSFYLDPAEIVAGSQR